MKPRGGHSRPPAVDPGWLEAAQANQAQNLRRAERHGIDGHVVASLHSQARMRAFIDVSFQGGAK
jgi:hypothetical protein